QDMWSSEELLMRIAARQSVLALVALVFGVTAPASGQTRDDEAAIRRAVEAMAVAFNMQDDQATINLATPDADFVLASGVWSKGVKEYVASRRVRAGGVLKNARVRLLDTKIRFVRADVALVHVLHEISGMSDASGKEIPPHPELNLRVFVKERGRWLITAFHNTLVTTPVK
ncbi:MAG: SgcJ/EcaC family oxidoreductase, partial [Vicinamibacterales bacterium]